MINFGIEVELWSLCTPRTIPILKMIRWERVSDGSVHSSDGVSSGAHQNEFRTITSYRVDLDNIDTHVKKIISDYKRLVETLTEIDVNESEGIHFHVSDLNKMTVLFSKSGFDYVHKAYKKLARTELEKKRLGGHINPLNERDTAYFCKWQYAENANDRYLAINYLPAWQRHKSIEFRFFPSTDKPNTLGRYVKFMLEIIKKFETIKLPKDRFSVVSSNKLESIDMKELVV